MKFREAIRTKILPVVGIVVFVLLIGLLTEFFTNYAVRPFDPETLREYRWIWLYFHHLFQMVLAIITILILGGGFKNYGFTLKSKDLYISPAIIVGVMFGIIMTLVDHLPTILIGSKITGYALNTTNVLGWLSFEWVFAGLSEEIFIRGLMMTFLMKYFDGHVRFFKWDVHIAGVIIAVMFALMHMSSFWSGNLIYAIGQQIYAFILGLCYAYFYEKSGSLFSPILSHNLSNGIEFVILFLLIWSGF